MLSPTVMDQHDFVQPQPSPATWWLGQGFSRIQGYVRKGVTVRVEYVKDSQPTDTRPPWMSL